MTSAFANWACPRCHVNLPPTKSGSVAASIPLNLPARVIHTSASLDTFQSNCPSCMLPYSASGETRFAYPYRHLLAEVSAKRFLRWSAAQNNGYISYQLMQGSSCAIEGRSDVERFKKFIRDNLRSAPRIGLDLGCGPLPQPAYLPTLPGTHWVGIDPFESAWDGSFVLGVGEFIPVPDRSIDLAVAATALDHTLDLRRTARELARVVGPGGSLMVWDHTFPSRTWIVLSTLLAVVHPNIPWATKLANLRANLLPERVRVYDNGLVLWTPKGYSDPFHHPRSRRKSWARKLRRTLETAGFVQVTNDPTTGFSHFQRRAEFDG